MDLVLKVVKYQHQKLSEPLSFTFDQQGGTIGRAMDNHWVLPDPHKYISAHHAIISYENGDYFITDTSSNGVFIYPSTVPLGKGNKIKLEEGQTLGIGEYEIEVHLSNQRNTLYPQNEDSQSTGAAAFNQPRPAGAASSAPPADFFAEAGPSDPLADFNPAPDDIFNPFDSASSSSQFDQVPKTSSADAPSAPQDMPADLFAGPSPFTDADPAEPSGDMVDDHFQTGIDAIAPENLFPDLPAGEDPFADLSPDGLPAQEQAVEIVQPDHASPLHEAFEPPRPAEPQALADWWEEDTADVREEVQKQVTQSQPSIPNEPLNEITLNTAARLNAVPDRQRSLSNEVITKFCQGARLDQAYAAQLDADAFYQIGLMFRTAVAGALEVLQSRAEIKNEMKLDMTMIKPQQNNPLKFAPTVDEALIRLLNVQPGYMDGVKAMQEAFEDIKVHQLAVISGMQFAIQTLLKKFDPKQLQKRLEQKHPIEAKIPIHRRARLWSLFEELYEDIEQEAQEDFNRLFDRAFAQAYEEQIKRFK